MKHILSLIVLATMMLANPIKADAQTSIAPRDAFIPGDAPFMEIAVDLAKASVAKGGEPGGCAIILNGAFHSSGSGAQPEVEALTKAHARSLANAVVYTVNEPITEAVIAMAQRGVSKIFFINARGEVVGAGVYDAAAYDDSRLPQDSTVPPMEQISNPDGAALLKR